MRRVLLFSLPVFLLIATNSAFSGFCYPGLVFFEFTQGTNYTVFYGEEVRLPIRMQANNCGMQQHQQWYLPPGTRLDGASGICAALYDGDVYMTNYAICDFNLVVKGEELNKVYTGQVFYHYWGEHGHRPRKHTWNNERVLDRTNIYTVTVIPHPLSIYGIPEQQATANTEFSFNAHDKIAYYDENVQSGHAPIVGFTPVGNAPPFAELGLSFDPATLILRGVPNRAGVFEYQVVAHNDYSTAAPVNFRLNIDYNQHDKPRFRANRKLAAMTPANAFRFNLLNLLETNPGFMLSNQVSFSLDGNSVGDNLAKIAIDSNGIDLIAEPPSALAGQILTAKIIAHSNTGGDSDEVEIQLPVALDAAMKPVINEGIQLTALAGDSMQHNLQANIVDPAQDANLRLVIDKIEPLAPWLGVSSSEPTTLLGNVPTDATGQQYILTLHANNQKGGDSIAQTVKLNIDIDGQRKSQFKQDNPVLNKLFPGQVYFYDFQQNRDVFPEYEDAPYTIKFAEGYSHPDWLVIENNQLKSIGMVPDDVEQLLKIHVVINNKVGGNSEIISLNLMAMV